MTDTPACRLNDDVILWGGNTKNVKKNMKNFLAAIKEDYLEGNFGNTEYIIFIYHELMPCIFAT
jgi:hypothetical protein